MAKGVLFSGSSMGERLRLCLDDPVLYIPIHEDCLRIAKTAISRNGDTTLSSYHIWQVLKAQFKSKLRGGLGDLSITPMVNLHNACKYGDAYKYQAPQWAPGLEEPE